MRRVLLIGPFPEPITGNSLANQIAMEAIEGSDRYRAEKINTSLDYFDESIGKFSLRKLVYYLKFNFQSFKVLRNDVVYITPGQTFFGVAKYAVFIFLADLLKKELIIHIHGNHLGNEFRSLEGMKKRFFSFLLSKATKGIVLSDSLSGNMTPFIDKIRIYELYNFAEDYIANDVVKSKDLGLRIVFLSNLMREKGIFELLNVLKRFENNKIEYSARIAGAIDASNKSEIEGKLLELDHAKYIGVVSGMIKKELLEWGNVFVLPTYYKMEGQPISIIEAMATGNVVVTTKYSGIPDIVNEPENGFFVKAKQEDDLFKVLQNIWGNPELIKTIGKNNQKYFKANFSLSSFKKNFIDILNA